MKKAALSCLWAVITAIMFCSSVNSLRSIVASARRQSTTHNYFTAVSRASVVYSPTHSVRSIALPQISRSHTYSSPLSGKQSRSMASTDDATEAEDTSVKGKLMKMWKNYGVVTIGTYLSIYVSVLSSFYFALDYDVFKASTFGLDPAAAVQKVCDLVEYYSGNNFLPGYIREHPKVGTFAIAWVMTKFTEVRPDSKPNPATNPNRAQIAPHLSPFSLFCSARSLTLSLSTPLRHEAPAYRPGYQRRPVHRQIFEVRPRKGREGKEPVVYPLLVSWPLFVSPFPWPHLHYETPTINRTCADIFVKSLICYESETIGKCRSF